MNIETPSGPLLGFCFLLALYPCNVQAQTWTLEPDPIFEVGGNTNDPLYTLSVVVGGTRLPNGNVVLADREVYGLRMYSPEGKFITEAGREGEGPGEYEYIRGIGPCAGGLVVAYDLHWDQKHYDHNLKLVAEHPAAIPDIGGSGNPYAFACNSTGSVVATGWGDFRTEFKEGYFISRAPAVLSKNGSTIHNFGERLGSERVGTLRPNGQPAGSRPHPFGRETNVAIGSDRVYVGSADAYEVEVYDLTGKALQSIAWDGPSRALTRSHWQEYEDALIAAASENQHPGIRRMVRDMPRLEQFPAYDNLVVDGADNLWVRYFPRPGETVARWLVFDGAGTQVGMFSIPQKTTILEIGADHLLVSELDELDVPTVRVYRLRKE